jgi:hypothetical protein
MSQPARCLHRLVREGSERLKKTLETADGPIFVDDTIKKESMCINQSLSYLEQCVVALNRKNPGHVPYRQSKLTTILKVRACAVMLDTMHLTQYRTRSGGTAARLCLRAYGGKQRIWKKLFPLLDSRRG